MQKIERSPNASNARSARAHVDHAARAARAEALREQLEQNWKPYFLEYMSCCGGGACDPRDPALPVSVLETHLR